MMSVPVTIRDDNRDGASDEGRIVAGTAGFTVKEKGSQGDPVDYLQRHNFSRVTADPWWRRGRLGD